MLTELNTDTTVLQLSTNVLHSQALREEEISTKRHIAPKALNALSASARGGLISSIEQSDADECTTDNRPFLGRTDATTHTAFFIQPDCKLWSCESCAAKRAAHWSYVINFGTAALRDRELQMSMVTLTSHRMVRTLVRGIKVWRSAWPKVSARMRRATPGMQYCYTCEFTSRGHFHAHLATTAKLNTRWYKTAGAETGLGYMAKAVPMSPGEYVGGYFSKYLTKSLDVKGWPRYWRRVNKSRKWPMPPDPEQPYTWVYVGNSIPVVELAMKALMRDGYRISHNIKSLNTT